LIPIQTILKNFLRDQKDNEEFLFAYLKLVWNKIVGEQIGKISEIDIYKNNMLRIKVYDESWLKPLEEIKDEIKEKANKFIGSDVINEIEIVKGRRNGKKDLKHRRKDKIENYESKDELKEAEMISDAEIRESFKNAYFKLQKNKKG